MSPVDCTLRGSISCCKYLLIRDTLLLIPQELGDAKFVITCTLKHKRSGGDYILFENKEITIPAVHRAKPTRSHYKIFCRSHL